MKSDKTRHSTSRQAARQAAKASPGRSSGSAARKAGTLTPRQKQILQMIESHIRQTGMPPTRTDICEHFGFRSPTAADDHLKALARKGAIELLTGTSRGIRLLNKAARTGAASGRAASSQLQQLPIIGRVAAGEPILAEEHIEDHCAVDPGVFSPRADFLLRVRGMSMCDIGILDGDLLAVHKSTEVHNNQIVVARVEDEVTVKRFRRRGNIVTLLPENKDFEPIQIDLRKQAFAIEGIYAGVLRNHSD